MPNDPSNPNSPHPPGPVQDPSSSAGGDRDAPPSQPPAGGPLYQPPSQPPGQRPSLEQDEIIAVVLSFIFPGVGHLILGQQKRGLAIIAAVILSCGFGYIFSIIVLLDAYCVALARKERPVGDWDFLPDYNRHLLNK